MRRFSITINYLWWEKITFMYDKYECITYQNVNGTSAVRDMYDSANMSYDLVLLIKNGNLEVVKKIT